MNDWLKKLTAVVLKPHKKENPQKIYPYDYCPEVECSSCVFVLECKYIKSC